MTRKPKAIPQRTRIAARLVANAPDTVRKALISDGQFTQDFGLPVTKSIHFGNAIAVEAQQFAGAINKIAAGKKSVRMAVNESEPVVFKGKLERDGAITLTATGIAITEQYAGVMSPKRATRFKTIAQMQKESLLPSERAQHWLDLAKGRELTAVEFLDFLDESRSTPEVWYERAREKRTLSLDAIMPADLTYYRTLLPEPNLGQTYDSYLRDTLAKERAYQLNTNKKLSFTRISVAALSQALIPFDLLQQISASELEQLLSRDDPFTLLFIFEVATRMALTDTSFIEIGSKALDKLFGDRTRSQKRATLFCGCTVLSVVGLRKFAAVRVAPLFWRRMLAFSHAGVLTNALVGELNSANNFNDWVLAQFGQTYFWNSLVERRFAPRWWPEWVGPASIETELVGRAFFALQAMPESQRPAPWKECIERLTKEQRDRKSFAQMFFPGPVDDFQFDRGQHDPTAFNSTLDALSKGQPLDQIQGLLPFLHMARLSQHHVNLLAASLANTPEPANSDFIPGYVNALKAAASAAAANRSLPLAEAIVEKTLKVFPRADSSQQEILLHTIVDSANAILDGPQHMSWLGERLERLAYKCTTTEQAKHLGGTIEWLSQADPIYGLYLSRARAVAGLYINREIRRT